MYAFLGMLGQAPIIMIQKKIIKLFKLEQSQLGNVFFWVSFCFIGQPLSIFSYYFEYRRKF